MRERDDVRREFDQKTNTFKTIQEILKNKFKIHANLFNYVGILLTKAILFLLDKAFKEEFSSKVKQAIKELDFENSNLFELLTNEMVPQLSKHVFEHPSLQPLVNFGFEIFFQKINSKSLNRKASKTG